jgi:SecD/SecF fusion protein
MLENVGRKITLILVLIAVSLLLLLIPEKPFNLGLDLQGGRRMVYSFDFDDALASGQITELDAQDPTRLIAETISIIRKRVDPTGVLEATIRQEGDKRMVVELPGSVEIVDVIRAESTLTAEMSAEEKVSIRIDPNSPSFEDFPEDGGRVRVGNEIVRYDRRLGSDLTSLRRGEGGSPVAPHPAGTPVSLEPRDPILESIENLGDLSFRIVAEDAKDGVRFDPPTDLVTERQRLRDWAAANPGTPVNAFNRVPYENGGPHPDLQWFVRALQEGELAGSEVERADPLLVLDNSNYSFRGSDLARVFASQDDMGLPAVGFEFQDSRKGDFYDFTEEYEQRSMAIVLNRMIDSAPNIGEPMNGRGIIHGQFSNDDVNALISVLRSGSLRIRPQLEHKEQIGPTLGADYVHRGLLSGILAIALVLGFMIVYYRGLGLFAALSMAASFLMLMGGLAILNATLTLPGLAGIILTIGMAVDANILIFDRIREEGDKGRNVRQAAKTGFEKALSAILDANITTMLTAIILYNVGTGPVRGFAVTLMIGIITAVFAALVITRVLVHFSLVRGAKSFPMGQWMVKADFDFLGKAKPAIACSLVLITAGLVLFVSLPAREKLGIDFLGGSEVTVRLDAPTAADDLRARVKAIPGVIGESSDVKAVLGSGTGDDLYTDFRIQFKTPEGSGEPDASSEGQEAAFEVIITETLADILVADGVTLDLERDSGKVHLSLAFSEIHTPADITERLMSDAGMQEINVDEVADEDFTYKVEATTSEGRSRGELLGAIRNSFRNKQDAAGRTFRLTTPIPASSTVGPQVVGELRDKALLALFFSMFVVVLYIRVRFAEYSYGFAAVAALLHDVLITLGVLTFLNWEPIGLINGEINLPTIAVFLTIIGYSLNDTIVIFDRVRENLPRMKVPMREVLNTSINQTLSRTILTSVTTFVAVATLFIFNYGTGNVLETFSFAMMVGILTGTYSTIFIANPTLLWLEARYGKHRTAEAEKALAKANAKA